MKHKLINNLGLKIISVFAAILLWLISLNLYDPIITKTFTDVEVTKTNEDSIAENKVVQTVENGKINFTVTGRKKVVNNLTIDDFTVSADLKNMVDLWNEDGYYTVQIEVVYNGSASSSEFDVKLSAQTMQIKIEDVKSSTFYVYSKVSGEPSEGYAVGTITVEPKQVEISGPESVIDSIYQVRVIPNVRGWNLTTQVNSQLILYDEAEQIMTGEQIENLIYNTSSGEPYVNVTVEIWPIKEVAISEESIDYVGVPAEGYAVTGIVISPETVRVAAKEEVLDALEEAIVLDLGQIDISGEKEDHVEELDVDLSELLNEMDLKLVDSVDIIVTIQIVKLEEMKIQISKNDISIASTSSSMNLEIVDQSLSFTVTGTAEALEGFSKDKVQASLDLSQFKGVEGGTYEVPVRITLPNGIELVDKEVFVKVLFSEK